MKILLIKLLLLSICITSFSQVKIEEDSIQTNGEIIVIRNNPLKRNGLILKFYTLQKVLKLKIDLITKEKTISANNISYLLDNNLVLLDGMYIEYYENGDTLQCSQFKENLKMGKQIKFDKGGIKTEELNIISPEKAHFISFYKNGNKQMEFNLVNDKKEGEENHYYEKGSFKASINFKNNHLDGELIDYDSSGIVLQILTYKNDKLLSMTNYPIIDSLKLTENFNQEIELLKKDTVITNYLKTSTISFDCELSPEGILKITKFKDNLPGNIKIRLHRWIFGKKLFKIEKFLNVYVKSNIAFNIDNEDSTYILDRLPYNAETNNHFYNPYYKINNIKYSAVFIDENLGTVYTFVEQMPEFQGGMDGLMKFIAKNLHYPEEARDNNIQGTVFMEFIVDIDGSVKNPKTVKGVNPILNAEALRVVKLLPKWIPGKQNGIAVRVLMAVPIRFRLE